jgi:transcriptional regulator with XRE-family HTH domain
MHGSLATKLRVLRAERGLTVRQAAALSGVAKETISQVERGERHPYDRTLQKLASAYDVPLQELIEEPVAPSSAGEPERPLAGSPKAKVPDQAGLREPELYLEGDIGGLIDADELARVAKALKAEWNRLAAYDRVVKLSREDYRETMRRLEEIEKALVVARERARALRKKLDEYEAEGVFELAAG